MVKLMHGFRRLARAGAGVLILHHVAKTKKSDDNIGELLEDMSALYRGGTGIVSIPEMAIGLVKHDDPEDPSESRSLLTLGEIRFRMCPEWQITAAIDWANEEHGRRGGISLTLVEDLGRKELWERKNGRKEAKAEKSAAKKRAENLVLAKKLEPSVVEDPTISEFALQTKSGIPCRNGKAASLLALLGWKYDRTGAKSGKWRKTQSQPMLSESEAL
jgi:hypothetical protein